MAWQENQQLIVRLRHCQVNIFRRYSLSYDLLSQLFHSVAPKTRIGGAAAKIRSIDFCIHVHKARFL